MIAGSFFITPHAVDQFRERICQMPYERALMIIATELRERCVSVKLSENRKALVARIRNGDWAFRAVICPPGAVEEAGNLPAVVTILRSGK